MINEEIDLSIFLELTNRVLQITGLVEYGMGAFYLVRIVVTGSAIGNLVRSIMLAESKPSGAKVECSI